GPRAEKFTGAVGRVRFPSWRRRVRHGPLLCLRVLLSLVTATSPKRMRGHGAHVACKAPARPRTVVRFHPHPSIAGVLGTGRTPKPPAAGSTPAPAVLEVCGTARWNNSS